MTNGRIGLTQPELNAVERWRREHRCFSSLGLDSLSRLIASAFAPVGRPWTATALADYLDVKRPTLLRRLQYLEEVGSLCHTRDGWKTTQKGADFLSALVSETCRIVEGEQVGYSEFVRGYVRATKFKDTPAAKTLSFPPFT